MTKRPALLLGLTALIAVQSLFPLTGVATAGEALELRLEGELGQLEPAPAGASAANLLPVLLGITNIGHRLQQTRDDIAAWKTANAALASHLMEREKHMLDLQGFVERQDGTIELLTQQAETMAALAVFHAAISS